MSTDPNVPRWAGWAGQRQPVILVGEGLRELSARLVKVHDEMPPESKFFGGPGAPVASLLINVSNELQFFAHRADELDAQTCLLELSQILLLEEEGR